MRILRRREVGIISERCHAVMEVDKELPACNFDEHYGYINTFTSTPASGGHAKARMTGFVAVTTLSYLVKEVYYEHS
jgi:hypothetical protein